MRKKILPILYLKSDHRGSEVALNQTLWNKVLESSAREGRLMDLLEMFMHLTSDIADKGESIDKDLLEEMEHKLSKSQFGPKLN
ncbi:MAG: hypothetical protein F4Y39_21180 [Gemmatimonadetes bacterium]|nr:hypothetical protein [Gemmatimonadota bacterium]MYF75624.1 hypothetical protein [Gemmatimonadota bacterium]